MVKSQYLYFLKTTNPTNLLQSDAFNDLNRINPILMFQNLYEPKALYNHHHNITDSTADASQTDPDYQLLVGLFYPWGVDYTS